MSVTDIDQDFSAEGHARSIGSAVLYVDPKGAWSVGKPGQKVSEYQAVKVGSNAVITDDSFEVTALQAETSADGGYVIYLQSNANPDVFFEGYFDAHANFTGGKQLSQSELFAAEKKLGVDLNQNGGLGDQMVLVDATSASLYVDGVGAFKIKNADGSYTPLTLGGSPITQGGLGDLELTTVQSTATGYDLYATDSKGAVTTAKASASGALSLPDVQSLTVNQVSVRESNTGLNLNGKGDMYVMPGWVSTLKTDVVRNEVTAQTAKTGKIDYAGAVKIIDTVIKSLTDAKATQVGADIFSDLQAIAARGKDLFVSNDLTGASTDYLQFVFGQLVNGSKANNFYTGGATQTQTLGNLSADSTIAVLQHLEDKWLLGKDLPNPTTEGDTANPNAAAATGVYKTFTADLMVGGAQAFDVNQGSAGTCYLLASMAALAQVNPTSLNSVFVANGTSGGSTTWGVRFYDTKGNANWVTVNNQLVVKAADDADAAYAKVKGVDTKGTVTQELWAPLIEKAYAQANELAIFGRQNTSNSMAAIEGGMADSIVNLVGGKVTTYADQVVAINENPILTTSVAPEGTNALSLLTAALNSGKAIWIGSGNKTESSTGATLFTGGHAFMAYDADTTSSTNTTIKVYNPWGSSAVTTDNPTPSYLAPFDGDLVNLVGVSGYDFWVQV